jgi:hypothetical protein
MGDAMWPSNSVEVERHGLRGHWRNMGGWSFSMAQVVVVLFWQ